MSNTLNGLARVVTGQMLASADEFRVTVHPIEGGGRFIDCGIAARRLACGHRADADLPGPPGPGIDRPG